MKTIRECWRDYRAQVIQGKPSHDEMMAFLAGASAAAHLLHTYAKDAADKDEFHELTQAMSAEIQTMLGCEDCDGENTDDD
jgi:hypothetical protein